jgi:hypothetical protein
MKDKKLTLKSKAISKQLLKSKEVTIHVPQPQVPERIRSSYFNEEYEKEKRKLFFK